MKGLFLLLLAACVSSLAMESVDKIKSQQKASFWQEVLNGGVAGALEVLLNSPLIVLKNELILQAKGTKPAPVVSAESWQEAAQAFVRKYYKGCGTGMASMIPITAFQNSMSLVFAQAFGAGKSLTAQALAAMQAGMLSSLLSSPADLVVLQRQNPKFVGESFAETMQRVLSQRGVLTLYRGVTGTGLRDGLFTVAYKSGGKLLQEEVRVSTGNKKLDGFLASILVAVVASVVSQPLDVVSAKMKSDLACTKYKTSFSTVQSIYTSEGLGAFMKGGWLALHV